MNKAAISLQCKLNLKQIAALLFIPCSQVVVLFEDVACLTLLNCVLRLSYQISIKPVYEGQSISS